MMKILLQVVLFGLFSLAACSSTDSDVAPVAGEGKLTLKVNLNGELQTTARKLSLSSDFVTVKIKNAANETVETYASENSIPAEITLSAGQYTATAQSNGLKLVAFDQPQYEGTTEPFSIAANATAAITLDCKIINTKVEVVFSDVVKESFDTYATLVKSSFGELTFEKGNTSAGFFKASGDLAITSTLGEGVEQVVQNTTITGIKPQTLYTVKVDIDNGSGKILITVDESLLEGADQTVTIKTVAGESRPGYNTSTGFFVKNGRLYDANGVDFVMRGINNPHYWFDNAGRDLAIKALPVIADYKSNTVRIVWSKNYDPARFKDVPEMTQLRKTLDACVRYGMVPILELHDVTGNESKEDLLDVAAYFTRPDVVQLLKAYESVLMINIANEWSGKGATYRDAYLEAVTMIRNVGLKHTIILDGNGWGQNLEDVFLYKDELINNDPQKNIVFSVHMYQSWRSETTITNGLERAVTEKLPLIVGEFGWKHGTPEQIIPHKFILEECQRLGIGWLAWSWKGNGGGVEYLDLSNDWEGTDLTQWGKDIFLGTNGTQETSQKASIFQ